MTSYDTDMPDDMSLYDACLELGITLPELMSQMVCDGLLIECDVDPRCWQMVCREHPQSDSCDIMCRWLRQHVMLCDCTWEAAPHPDIIETGDL
ncbi:hypothetical protein P0W64_15350 [Tsukamurella sp. 8F]|uniref:hypothetical protein n=1 Tax=unclassified Tsukamurella TaxID=2633480 RepID=UPI0023B92766|nr:MULTISPECIES: hypothetical protein [unclassified Tsukamurella]MDF0530901.1 hypothetical protein [Tsukamurella sp. 8J]MDF0588154.1 hypothetical protein [Tsukamurella sp. 8F]